LYNGPGDRYDWKIVGKREVYVPYDNYKAMDSTVKYNDLLTKGHENPSYVRYELHRVWVLQATLKNGYRHQYAKRVLYIDEDSWMTLLADNYDARGQLWRTNVAARRFAVGRYAISVDTLTRTAIVWMESRKVGQYDARELSVRWPGRTAPAGQPDAGQARVAPPRRAGGLRRPTAEPPWDSP
ncbi:DUF1329 domain-containing protein, partial [Burkholderia pseudomallei]|uniref:DUF1329 domain-containing protein n=1 Tax=Burkholderia pseudomallei TaxID=28450 RepID=UPI0021F7CFF1